MIQPEKWCPFHEPEAALSEMVRRGFMPPRADGSVRRPFHSRSHGCLIGELQIEPSELPEYRQGIFASARVFPAVARFSSAFLQDDRDPDVRGLAIKVSGVSGEFCDGAEPGVQDFLMVSHPAAPSPTPGLRWNCFRSWRARTRANQAMSLGGATRSAPGTRCGSVGAI